MMEICSILNVILYVGNKDKISFNVYKKYLNIRIIYYETYKKLWKQINLKT